MAGSVGSLQTFQSGYVRYVPLASQWNSVVARGSAGDCLQNIDTEIPDDDDDLQIPLVRNGSVSKDELLSILPPGRYCDTLKEVYFSVFSPVCLQNFPRGLVWTNNAIRYFISFMT